jgi:hypothetical protein
MRRRLVITVVMLGIIASTVRIRYHELGLDWYWEVEIVAPWHR